MAAKPRENYREMWPTGQCRGIPRSCASYTHELGKSSDAAALWTVANKIEPWQPKYLFSSGSLALRGFARACAPLGRAVSAEKAGKARHLSEQSGTPRACGRRSAGSIPACRSCTPARVASSHCPFGVPTLRFDHGREGAPIRIVECVSQG